MEGVIPTARKECCIYEHKEGAFADARKPREKTYPRLYLMGAGARAGGPGA